MAKERSDWRQVGSHTLPAVGYTALRYNSVSISSKVDPSQAVTGRLYAQPLVIGVRAQTIGEVSVATHASHTNSNATWRLGLYQNAGNQLYPTTLITGGVTGPLNTPSVVYAVTMSQVLTANTLYWMVGITSRTASGANFQDVGLVFPFLGLSPTTFRLDQAASHLYVPYSYGAGLPATYPTTGAVLVQAAPCLQVLVIG